MGCGGSKEEVEAGAQPEVETPQAAEELVEAKSEDVKISLNIAESDAVKAKPGVRASTRRLGRRTATTHSRRSLARSSPRAAE